MKLSLLLEEITNELYNDALDIVKKLKDNGYEETYFVGGWVRDKLLGLDTAKDIDIATSAKPEEIKKIFKDDKFIEVGESFNIVMIVRGGETIEIASFRSDGDYISGRRPEEVYFSTAKEDAERRDFTVNALFYDPIEDKYIDYVGDNL